MRNQHYDFSFKLNKVLLCITGYLLANSIQFIQYKSIELEYFFPLKFISVMTVVVIYIVMSIESYDVTESWIKDLYTQRFYTLMIIVPIMLVLVIIYGFIAAISGHYWIWGL